MADAQRTILAGSSNWSTSKLVAAVQKTLLFRFRLTPAKQHSVLMSAKLVRRGALRRRRAMARRCCIGVSHTEGGPSPLFDPPGSRMLLLVKSPSAALTRSHVLTSDGADRGGPGTFASDSAEFFSRSLVS